MPDWQDHAAWRVLDTQFCDGARFHAVWSAWARDEHAPRVLHYVAIAEQAPPATTLLQRVRSNVLLAAQAQDLQRQWQALAPGFHRLELSAGRVLLTLCVGPLQPMLREQEFVADAILLPPQPAGTAAATGWDRWTRKALVRLCRRGTTVQVPDPPAAVLQSLTEAGFVFAPRPGPGMCHGSFQPRWEPPSTRHRWRDTAQGPSDCVVVGAGLAGATAAASLARRGWQVTVLDAAPEPCAGASGLPVGLVAPQISRDDNTRSRLSQAGVRLTHQWCHVLLAQAADWDPCGIWQLQPGAPPAVPVWHPSGAWIKPASLVAACLARPGVHFRGGARVAQLVHDGATWLLLDANGTKLAGARQLVVAAAAESLPLLQKIGQANTQQAPARSNFKAMQILGGQVSWGLERPGDAAHFPDGPVNGHGSFVPHVPFDGAPAWFAGATYDTTSARHDRTGVGHLENLQRLAQLLPATADVLAARFKTGEVRAWRGSRCVSPDRLPAVGPLDTHGHPPVWLSLAMGSRGLTYAVLCAELLAARMGGEPLPLPGSLARLLAANRPGLLASHHL